MQRLIPLGTICRREDEMAALVTIVVVLVVLVVLALSVRIVQQYEKGVLFRLGWVIGVREPGLTLIVPLIVVLRRVSLRIVTIAQTTLRKVVGQNTPGASHPSDEEARGTRVSPRDDVRAASTVCGRRTVERTQPARYPGTAIASLGPAQGARAGDAIGRVPRRGEPGDGCGV